METPVQNISEYYVPYKETRLYVKFFDKQNTIHSSHNALLIVHWMDVRGHKGNSIYDKIGTFFSEKGIPVILFDVLGSGSSKGTFEFPQQQRHQIKVVYDNLLTKLTLIDSNIQWDIIPIVHSVSAVAIMCAINDGLTIKRLIWLGGPPSHADSIKRSIKKSGRFNWYIYRFMAKFDNVSGLIGFPITKKLFGFRLRIKDMYKSFSKAHGAKLMLPHKEMDIIAIFGSKDEYMVPSDIEAGFSAENSSHIKKVIIKGADHSFERHIEELITILDQFINKKLS